MAATDKVFAGSIPKIYDDLLVPLIFAGPASDLAARIAALAPAHVLETAAGTGVVTRALAAALPATTQIVATDLNQPMLDMARSRQPATPPVVWQQADAMSLPFADARFDVVGCQFGAMFFPDRIRAYREARRVLKPGGHFLFSVWDRIEKNVFADDVTNALAGIFPGDPPRFLARTPHGHHDPERIRTELQAAGFTSVAIEPWSDLSRASSPRHPAVAYCQGTPLRNEIETRGHVTLEQATDHAAAAIAARHGDGPVAAEIASLVVTAA